MERESAQRKFNSPDGNVDVLITSTQLNSFGVNYHRMCHRGILLEMPQNLNTQLQVFGRLWRIGQQHKVVWKVLLSRHTWDFKAELGNLSKFAKSLAAEGRIDDRVRGELREIVAFEIMRLVLGQPYSRYALKTKRLRAYHSEDVVMECRFYSAVGQLLLTRPDAAAMVEEHGLEELALRWDPAAPLRPEDLETSPRPGVGIRLVAFDQDADTGSRRGKKRAAPPETPTKSSGPLAKRARKQAS